MDNDYEDIKKLLEYYKSKLENEYLRANSPSKKKRIAFDLELFSSMCSACFDDIVKDFSWDTDKIIKKNEIQIKKGFFLNILKNQKMFMELSESVLNSFINSNYPLYKDYYQSQYFLYKKIPGEELSEIIKSFINDYDPKWFNNIKQKADDSLIYSGQFYDYGGFVYPIPIVEKSFVFNSDGWGNSIFSACNRVHEYGHTYEFDLDYEAKMISNIKNMNMTPFTEVASTFFEYAFLRYLKENKIYEDSADLYLRYYYMKLLIFNYELNILTKMKKINLGKNYSTILNDENVMKEAEEIKEKLNFYDLVSYNRKINFRDVHIYGVGTLLSIYLYDNYQQDKNNFKKEFKNSLLTYPQIKDLSAFNNVGISEEDIIKGNVLRKVLKNSI